MKTFRAGLLLAALLLPISWLRFPVFRPEGVLGAVPSWPFWFVLLPVSLYLLWPDSGVVRRVAWVGLLLYCCFVIFILEMSVGWYVAFADRQDIAVPALLSHYATMSERARLVVAVVGAVMLILPPTLRYVWRSDYGAQVSNR